MYKKKLVNTTPVYAGTIVNATRRSKISPAKKKLIYLSAIILLILSIAFIWLSSSLHYNFHTVVANQVYRSAQLPENILQEIIHKYKIRSIINLRNKHPDALWWQQENTTAKQNHALLYNLSLPAHGLPTPLQLKTLTQVLQAAPLPMLIHCRQGIDRSGLASALMLILRNEASTTTIYRQVSWHYFAFDTNSVGKKVLENYFHWLKLNNKKQSSVRDYYFWLEQF